MAVPIIVSVQLGPRPGQLRLSQLEAAVGQRITISLGEGFVITQGILTDLEPNEDNTWAKLTVMRLGVPDGSDVVPTL